MSVTAELNSAVINKAFRDHADVIWGLAKGKKLSDEAAFVYVMSVLAKNRLSEYGIGYITKYLLGKYPDLMR